MSRQHAAPLIISADGHSISTVRRLSLGVGGHDLDEASIQEIVHRHPACLPIAEIDPLFVDPVPICRELVTPAGAIDNLLVTASGLPVLVECKLWRNPEGRREVVGQILDYSKELTRWSASDLQREVSRRLKRSGNVMLELLREAGHNVDEISFNDALTHKLRRGRFLLLIVGDGIREGVEAISEYLQVHAGLHFTLGLVELPIYAAPDGARIIAPRILARTQTIVRTVVAVPEGMSVAEDEGDHDADSGALPETPERRAGRERRNALRKAFWSDFLEGLRLDDPDQMKPPPSLGGHVVFKLGAPSGSSWITVFRDARGNSVGLALSGNAGSVGERAAQALAEQASEIRAELGPDATIDFSGEKPIVSERFEVPDIESDDGRAKALAWLQDRTNAFVNTLRPRIRSALHELAESSSQT
jgi:hypothetical protein